MAFDEKLAARIRDAFAGERDVIEKEMFGSIVIMVPAGISAMLIV